MLARSASEIIDRVNNKPPHRFEMRQILDAAKDMESSDDIFVHSIGRALNYAPNGDLRHRLASAFPELIRKHARLPA